MVGSLLFHAVLVTTSQLAPSAPKPDRLRIVSIAPSTVGHRSKTKLAQTSISVPALVPPINLGQIPKLWKFPLGSKLTSRPKSLLLGPVIPTVDLNQIQLLNPSGKPALSGFQGLAGSKFIGESPQPLMPKAMPLNNLDALIAARSEANKPQTLQPKALSPSQTASPSQNPPPQTAPSPATSTVPTPKSSTTPSDNASEGGIFQQWAETHSYLNVQEVSAQAGPTLVAAYPPAACASQQQGTVVLAALYGPDGNLASGSDTIKIIAPGAMAEITQAARIAVSNYHPSVAEGYRAIKFDVQVFYSSDICQKPESPITTASPAAMP